MIVLDTNIVLDAFVFNDPATQPLKLALASRKIQWIATKAMRDELARVLAYPKIDAAGDGGFGGGTKAMGLAI